MTTDDGWCWIDGSILPTGGRSGPHATIMMVAVHIGNRFSDEG